MKRIESRARWASVFGPDILTLPGAGGSRVQGTFLVWCGKDAAVYAVTVAAR
jgi:hypothetical protein